LTKAVNGFCTLKQVFVFFEEKVVSLRHKENLLGHPAEKRLCLASRCPFTPSEFAEGAAEGTIPIGDPRPLRIKQVEFVVY